MRIVGVSNGRIQWPIGQTHRAKSPVLYRDLARAVRREGASAVAFWWGVGRTAVHKWRRALGVPRINEGDGRLQVANGKRNTAGQAALAAYLHDALRIAKVAATLRGRPRPPHVMAAVRRANLGRKLTAEHRQKIAAALKGLRRKPARDLRLICTLPPAEAARQTGRTLAAVYKQRARLHVGRPCDSCRIPLSGRSAVQLESGP